MSRPIGNDLTGYYRLHAPIYDLTRPFFLFARRRLLDDLVRLSAKSGRAPMNILEIGCGTGTNLAMLGRAWPQARLVGVDLAAPMLERAQRRLGERAQLIHGALGQVPTGGPFDLVLASYMLTMTGAEQPRCIAAARAELAPGGLLAVVDFLSTPSAGFARWMGHNHVRFDADLPSRLQAQAAPLQYASRNAFGGAWRYFSWIGP